jgi:hypothetical protein
MIWTPYRVTFKLLSPMHIGWRKLGNLQQTRPYVTGRVLWGALTARLTRESDGNDYKSFGDLVDDQLAFTYFYPSNNPYVVSHWPWAATRDEFAWNFMGSYASTSLANGRNAEDGSLHETEFIAPHTRGEDSQQVYLVGYIFEKDGYSIKRYWQDVLDKLQFGGERGYGWGRVEKDRVERVEEKREEIGDKKYLKCFDYDLDCVHNRPLLIAPKEDMRLLAHTVATDEPDRQRGAIEPLVRRETGKDTGFGNKFPDVVEICWIPGGKVDPKETFQIGEKGIWRPFSE